MALWRTLASHEMPNYALERSVRGSNERAAGARRIIAPAAPSRAIPRPAQRGR